MDIFFMTTVIVDFMTVETEKYRIKQIKKIHSNIWYENSD